MLDIQAAHLDILLTIADLCGATLPDDRKIDGISFLPQCMGQKDNRLHHDRAYFVYWTRRSIEKYHNMSVLKGEYKLVANNAYDDSVSNFELYDINEDPFELNNLSQEKICIAEQLKGELEQWYNKMITSPNLQQPIQAIIGTANENPTVLNRNDAFGMEAIWSQQKIFAFGEVEFAKEARYNITFKFSEPIDKKGTMKIQIGAVHYTIRNEQIGVKELRMNNILIPKVKGQLMAWYYQKGSRGMEALLPFTVEIDKNKFINSNGIIKLHKFPIIGL